ncbi:hypothetical protein MUS_2140 [Bacillus sp. CN2]|uniref:Uncharacterized protein n=1 Tax=Bacillus amyloliquefaciens (strain Y2) TaxID=1155777 RepID=I2C625_BACAY|nr:hypothetical protein MUS_2140 [Bacillus velezensis YAU B9601-Y2]ANF36749.1 hypothetical protein BCBMB205_18510 [Bacillus velezensis]KYC90876.1 hypothetical protein B4140_1735 [Bacillus amyloliquefaciens]GFR53354.1 hypothetical protein MUS_2140 [Bacillus sp. CN2]ARZ58187.1 hypothetical protein BAGQ_1953 [Bacillus velezensis]
MYKSRPRCYKIGTKKAKILGKSGVFAFLLKEYSLRMMMKQIQ